MKPLDIKFKSPTIAFTQTGRALAFSESLYWH